MILFSAIILGFIIGSFLNAVIYRLDSGDSITHGRSLCPHCGHKLLGRDLIPVFSFVWLKGRCRHCQQKISWQYPLVEIITAGVFALLYLKFGLSLEGIMALVFAVTLIVIGVFDFKYYLILDKVLLPIGLLALGWNIFMDYSAGSFSFAGYTAHGLFSGLGLVLFFGLQYVLSHGRWIGLGDVKFGLVLGLMLGWPLSLCMLMLAYFFGAFIGLSLMAFGQKQMSSPLPFGSFLAFSAIITLLWGDIIVAWYSGLIGL